jgi:glycosyltransferase involved in cell wall biosynthesis
MNPYQAALEQQLMQQSDLNFVVAPSLIDPQWMRPNSWIYLPNGVAAELFARAQSQQTQTPRDIADLPAPRIGYIGAVHPDWVDVERLIELAHATPEWSWVIIGPKIRWSPPAQCPKNLYFLGARPYTQLPAYLKGLDVCIIPFRRNAISQGASPLKLYEYLAAGKAVVSVPYFHDLELFADLVYTAETLPEWLLAIRAALAEAHTPAQIARRMQSVAPHSWQSRAECVLQTLNSAF